MSTTVSIHITSVLDESSLISSFLAISDFRQLPNIYKHTSFNFQMLAVFNHIFTCLQKVKAIELLESESGKYFFIVLRWVFSRNKLSVGKLQNRRNPETRIINAKSGAGGHTHSHSTLWRISPPQSILLTNIYLKITIMSVNIYIKVLLLSVTDMPIKKTHI